MKIKLGAVIPTVQYGNLQPEFEVEADDPIVAVASLEELIQNLWDKYGERPLVAKTSKGKLLKAWVGGEIYYDDVMHTYTNESGDVYLSGSVYASSFEKPFDTASIAEKMSVKSGVSSEDIIKMWDMKRDISNGFGTAIHAAMELYGKYSKHSESFDKDYHLHDHPVIKNAVESFYEGRSKEVALYEALVVDHARKYAGQIDRVVKEGDVYFIEDFKTNAKLKSDKLKNYWKQLSFYASIVEASGLKVGGLRIHHWNGDGWKTYEHEVETIARNSSVDEWIKEYKSRNPQKEV